MYEQEFFRIAISKTKVGSGTPESIAAGLLAGDIWLNAGTLDDFISAGKMWLEYSASAAQERHGEHTGAVADEILRLAYKSYKVDRSLFCGLLEQEWHKALPPRKQQGRMSDFERSGQ